LALAVRRQRESQCLSQQQLAARIKTSQPRIAKIERAASDVSLDQLVRAFTAAGGTIDVKIVERRAAKKLPIYAKTAKKPVADAVRVRLTTSKKS
jgi:transcriptional regulator with XRE-family HTH domain